MTDFETRSAYDERKRLAEVTRAKALVTNQARKDFNLCADDVVALNNCETAVDFYVSLRAIVGRKLDRYLLALHR